MSERSLATVVKIESLEPIEGADSLLLAKMENRGWQVVVKRGEFKVGQLACYFETDSFLPIRQEFEFLRKSCLRTMDNREGFRLKVIKLRGTRSEGLLIPLESLFTLEEKDNKKYIKGVYPNSLESNYGENSIGNLQNNEQN